jgi:hypothetical protein
MFREYKITGMKLVYRPYDLNIRTTDVVLKPITCGTIMGQIGAFSAPADVDEFRASLDAKLYSPLRGFKRYYHLSKWGSGKEINWRTC